MVKRERKGREREGNRKGTGRGNGGNGRPTRKEDEEGGGNKDSRGNSTTLTPVPAGEIRFRNWDHIIWISPPTIVLYGLILHPHRREEEGGRDWHRPSSSSRGGGGKNHPNLPVTRGEKSSKCRAKGRW